MKKLDEETALSTLFANTKRKKRNVDIITIAKSCEYLVKLYGSQKAVAAKIGLSTEMIREFLITLKLPKEVQKIIKDRKIDSIDMIKEIYSLKDSKKQIAAAKAFTNSSSKDVRDIKRLMKYGNIPLENAKKIILDIKPKGLHLFLIDFDDKTYKQIMKQAKKMKIDPAEMVRGVVIEWLNQN